METQQDKPKKTRDLPNLSECQSCGFRIDTCDTNEDNNTLQTLYSEWRIIILCKICFVGVESSNLCSYCFKGKNNTTSSFNCAQCERFIHKSCFANYSKFSPWSFSSKFSVCVDCWVPKSIAAKRAYVYSKKNKKKKLNLNSEDVVMDVNCDVRKVEAAVRARDLVVEKALAARKATDLTHNAVDLVSDRTVGGLCLAYTLDDPTRMLNNLSSVSSAGSNQLLDSRGCRKCDVSLGGRSAIVEPAVTVRVSDYDVLGLNRVDDSWTRQNGKDFEVRYKEGEGSCSDKVMNSECQSCREGDGSIIVADEIYMGKPDRYLIKYARRTTANEGCKRKPDRYLKKYVRRISARGRYAGKIDRYSRKYTRRRTGTDEIKNAKLDRFSIKYTRRSLNQRAVHDNSFRCLYELLHHE
ncbi:uncharacterized protein LOC126682489 [Mercurialis annua]|uniref:uncharacterized protein LOC126682489 n=1 Tax=Mercurialis annua TaxID=3986 RepID=UPI00215EF329|nr:uncharacterized protein LOC126682489 [Mercurialis annua]